MIGLGSDKNEKVEKVPLEGGEGVPTPNGKCHEKFPYFLDPFHNQSCLL